VVRFDYAAASPAGAEALWGPDERGLYGPKSIAAEQWFDVFRAMKRAFTISLNHFFFARRCLSFEEARRFNLEKPRLNAPSPDGCF
jgi:hypothetical protein